MAEPRPGYRSTLTLEMVDPQGLKMSDGVFNWYGFEGPASEAEHNLMQTALVRAVNDEVKNWIPAKAERSVPTKLTEGDLSLNTP